MTAEENANVLEKIQSGEMMMLATFGKNPNQHLNEQLSKLAGSDLSTPNLQNNNGSAAFSFDAAAATLLQSEMMKDKSRIPGVLSGFNLKNIKIKVGNDERPISPQSHQMYETKGITPETIHSPTSKDNNQSANYMRSFTCANFESNDAINERLSRRVSSAKPGT